MTVMDSGVLAHNKIEWNTEVLQPLKPDFITVKKKKSFRAWSTNAKTEIVSIWLANKYLQIKLVWFWSLFQRQSLEWLNLLRSDSLKPAVTLLLPLLQAHGTLTEYIISANNMSLAPSGIRAHLIHNSATTDIYISKVTICSGTQPYSL